MSIQILCQVFNWVVFDCWAVRVLYIFWIQVPYHRRNFFLLHGLSLHCLSESLWSTGVFHFWWSPTDPFLILLLVLLVSWSTVFWVLGEIGYSEDREMTMENNKKVTCDLGRFIKCWYFCRSRLWGTKNNTQASSWSRVKWGRREKTACIWKGCNLQGRCPQRCQFSVKTRESRECSGTRLKS